jgi:hypothetical protein
MAACADRTFPDDRRIVGGVESSDFISPPVRLGTTTLVSFFIPSFFKILNNRIGVSRAKGSVRRLDSVSGQRLSK